MDLILELYVKSDGRIFKYNFDTKKIYFSDNLYFKVNKKTITFNNKSNGLITINLLKDTNILKNSFRIDAKNISNLSGLVKDEFLTESMKIDSLVDDKKKRGILGKNPVLTKFIKINLLKIDL